MSASHDNHAAPAPAQPAHPPAKSGKPPGKGQAMMKLVLVFFISLFSFAVGTYVGKTYSDQKHKTAALEPKNHLAVASNEKGHGEKEHGEAHEAAGHDEEHGEARSVASAHDTQETMSDEEIARLAEEYVKDDDAPAAKDAHGDAHGKEDEHGEHGVADKHGDKHDDKHGEAEHKDKEDDHKSAVAEKSDAHSKPAAVAKKQPILPEDADSHLERSPASPNKKKVEEPMHAEVEKNTKSETAKGRKPSSLPSNPIQDSIGKYTVQIASFASEGEAKQRAAQLRTQGYNAFYVQAIVKGNVWFRVSIGLFNTERDAKIYMSDYRKGNSAIQAIVQKITAE